MKKPRRPWTAKPMGTSAVEDPPAAPAADAAEGDAAEGPAAEGPAAGASALERMSDLELRQLEDRLRLRAELHTGSHNHRFAADKLALFALVALFWGASWFGAALFMKALLPRQAEPLANYVGILLILPMGIFAVFYAARTWERLGLRGRELVRAAFHYWPLTLAAFATIWSQLRQ